MLLSALKILIFFAIVLAVTLGVLQLSETGDGLTLVYGGTEYTLGPVQTLIAVTVTVLLGWLAVRLLGLLLDRLGGRGACRAAATFLPPHGEFFHHLSRDTPVPFQAADRRTVT